MIYLCQNCGWRINQRSRNANTPENIGKHFLYNHQKSVGKSLLLVISPNLINLYPELIPNIYIDSTRVKREDEYEVLIRLLNKHKIPYVDTFQILKDLKEK